MKTRRDGIIVKEKEKESVVMTEEQRKAKVREISRKLMIKNREAYSNLAKR